MPGLDPGIHIDCQRELRFIMDRRVKPGHDEIGFINRPKTKAPARATDLGFTRDRQLKLPKPAVAGLGGFDFFRISDRKFAIANRTYRRGPSGTHGMYGRPAFERRQGVRLWK